MIKVHHVGWEAVAAVVAWHAAELAKKAKVLIVATLYPRQF